MFKYNLWVVIPMLIVGPFWIGLCIRWLTFSATSGFFQAKLIHVKDTMKYFEGKRVTPSKYNQERQK